MTDRVLGAAHLRDIFLWVVEGKGEVWFDRSGTSETIVLSPRDVPNVEIAISSLAIKELAKQLRPHTAIDVSANVDKFTLQLAHIAEIVYYAGPKVSGRENVDEIEPLVHEISVEFAVACVIQFAESRNYVIDRSKIPARETSIALLMIDVDRLANIFAESIYPMPGGDGPDRRAGLRPRSDAEHDALAYIRFLESCLADGNPIPVPVSKDADRHISATDYRKISIIARREGWGAEQMLIVIDGYLSQYAAQRSAEALIRFLMKRHADINVAPDRATKGGDRRHSAKSHWNLRETALLKEWSDHETVKLIEEHLFPKLDGGLVHYSNTDSGPDWARLYDVLFRSDGQALWKFRVASSR